MGSEVRGKKALARLTKRNKKKKKVSTTITVAFTFISQSSQKRADSFIIYFFLKQVL